MHWTPKEAQILMRDFIIATPRCNVWADMGMAKTSSALTALDILWLAGSQFWPALVIAPKRVARDTWGDEGQKWDHLQHLRVSKILGNPEERVTACLAKADVYTTNYENIPWLVEFFGGQKRWPFKIIIADESRKLQGFRIVHGGIRAAALSKIAKITGRWVNLTGTPAPEGLTDLWGPNWFIDFGATLGRTHTSFSGRWFHKTDYGLEPYKHAKEEMMKLIAPFTISLESKDYYPDLEDPVERPVYVDLPPAARKAYDSMELDMFAQLPVNEVEAMNSGSKYGKCSQLASGAIYIDDRGNWELVHDCKIKALKEIMDELCGDPLLVAYHFQHDKARILKAFPEARVFDTAQDSDDWNAGKIKMMLAHPQSAGHGLNWQDGGCNIALFSQIPSLELRQQIIQRLGPLRQLQSGHPRPVNVWNIIARDTVNEVDYARAKTKATIQSEIRAYQNRKRR
jgi:SNF2 family DNA or RNA helicase